MKIGAGKNKMSPRMILSFFAGLILSCSHSPSQFEQYVFRGATMGTTFNIKIVEKKSNSFDYQKTSDEIEKVLDDVNRKMSTYIPDSELSRFNQAPAGEWFPVSAELCLLFKVSQQVSQKSGGAFDITVGPLVNLWGFGPEKRANEMPAAEEINERKAHVGYAHILIRHDPPALKKELDSMYCDLSAIAKGWGVDQVADKIEADGHENYLVEIGGEIRARGLNLNGNPWRVGVSSPDAQFAIQKVIEVQDVGVATSGDYRNYFEKDGVRYSHTIDPSTSRPITHNLASITVIHPSCMWADAYATAIDVLGPTKGMELAEKENLPIFMVVKEAQGFSEIANASFKSLIQD
ncbi:MAG: FAD:protein FMN transferase [Calditrichaeota bacterium]|nr:MAG: FAD:protein FMN transferase [Calditrichota bacterium]